MVMERMVGGVQVTVVVAGHGSVESVYRDKEGRWLF